MHRGKSGRPADHAAQETRSAYFLELSQATTEYIEGSVVVTREIEAIPTTGERRAHAASWVPSAYFAEGIPYAMVIWVAGTMFKDLGHSDSQITVGTASIGIAWSLKPLWAAFLDMARTKRFWVLLTESAMCVLLAFVAMALRMQSYFTVVLALLWVLAFISATHDICVDGVYITALDERRQAAWMGVQGMCWNVARIFMTSGVVALAGMLESHGRTPKEAWTIALGGSAATMGVLAALHTLVLPTGSIPRRPSGAREVFATFWDAARAFLAKPSIVGMLMFVFLYRTGEGFLLQEAPLFMQSPVQHGGLGLTLTQKAFVDGTVSTTVSVVGGLAGAWVASKLGLKRSLLLLAFAMNVPHLCYTFLAFAVSPQAPLSLHTIQILVSIEKFGYSFGFVGNMLYMMQQLAPGKYKMTHYAFATALMNLVLVPTQMVSGPLADWLGYRGFFVFVLVASIPSIIAAWRAPFPQGQQAARAGVS
jgi:PAT family beta-lactamase induction signal transducer AmpG